MRERHSLLSNLIGIVFNRITITALLFLIQFLYVIVLLVQFQDYAGWVGTAMGAFGLFMILMVVWSSYHPAYKIGWMFLIAVMPAAGALLYLLYGRKRTTKSLQRKILAQEVPHRHDLDQVMPLETIEDERMRTTARYLHDYGLYPAWTNTETKYYPLGDSMFADMLEDLKSAEHFVFIEYFIIGRGELWDSIFAILKEKAAQGVDIRIIYDDFGSARILPKHFVKNLRGSGISVMAFNTVKPIFSLIYNNRDHRKIMVIDGHTAYSGGANIADEYANKTVRFGHWKDAGIRLRGDAVWNFTVMFLNMWNTFEKRDGDYKAFAPHAYHPEPFEADGVIQPFSDSPLDDERVGETVYFEIRDQATENLYIFTPYLVLDNETEEGLKTAAKRGVDVRLIVPGIPDKRVVYSVTRSYYANLMKAGVKIYEYSPGFLHSKCVLCDNKAAVVGTINFDFRSFFLHFECGTLIMENREVIEGLREDFVRTMLTSERLNEEGLRKRYIGSVLGFALRLFSPLL